MRKEFTKGFVMVMLVVALALVTAVASANGQSQQARVTVPFDFVVGNQTLATGQYDVATINGAADCLSFRNTAIKDSATRLTVPLDGKSRTAKLVFHRYGQTYFLAEVWTGNADHGRQLLKSRQEMLMEKELARIASLRGPEPSDTFEKIEIAMARN